MVAEVTDRERGIDLEILHVEHGLGTREGCSRQHEWRAEKSRYNRQRDLRPISEEKPKKDGQGREDEGQGGDQPPNPPDVAPKQQRTADDLDAVASLDRIRPAFERLLNGPAGVMGRCRHNDDVGAAALQELRDFTGVTTDAGEFRSVIHAKHKNFLTQAVSPSNPNHHRINYIVFRTFDQK